MKKNTPNVATDKLTLNPFYFGGKILRKLSIDELPQLINIINGDINFIGPRPALYNQAELISERKRLGISVLKPGITGWAQVNGRDNISEKEKQQNQILQRGTRTQRKLLRAREGNKCNMK